MKQSGRQSSPKFRRQTSAEGYSQGNPEECHPHDNSTNAPLTHQDRIAEQTGEIPVPERRLALAEERLSEYRRDPTGARPAGNILNLLAKHIAEDYAS